MTKKILAMILAGGKGERLYPLTRDRAKPAVPFGGIYRIIDFTISNCVNSGMRRIYVLTQYKSLSLDRHIQRAWNFLNNRLGEFVYIIHAQQRINETWYKGTADAIYQNFYTLQQERPDLVMILSGDHIYKMDYQEMIRYHLENNADLTLATMEIGKEHSRHFGVIEVDRENKVIGFQEKPARPRTIPSDPGSILINMGVYIFNTDILVKRLIENAKKSDTQHDFGKNVIPWMLKKDKVYAFPHRDKTTGTPGYWKDVGTIEAYYEANLDLLSEETGPDLFDRSWPIFTYEKQASPAKVTGLEVKNNTVYGTTTNSFISKGCHIRKARVDRSILSPFVSVGEYSTLEGSVVFDNVTIGKNCSIKNAVIDKEVTIPDGSEIGYDLKHDARKFTVTDSGIIVIPRSAVV